MNKAEQLKPGVTTKAQAIEILGKPESVSTFADESQLVQWLYSQAYGGMKHLAVLFGKDGVMIRITQQTY